MDTLFYTEEERLLAREQARKVLEIFAVSFITYVLGIVLCGYALSVLWGWFVFPTFNLPLLPIAPAIGIALAADYLTRHPSIYLKKAHEDLSLSEMTRRSIVVATVKPGSALLIGWIVHLFM